MANAPLSPTTTITVEPTHANYTEVVERDEYAEAAFNERRIPSRYVEGIRNSFDPHARQEHAVRAFREALTLCRLDADRRRLAEEESLALALDGLGATRHRADGATMVDLRERRAKSEKEAERWGNMIILLDSIVSELDDHHGLYTETFVHQMELSTHEIKTAPWGHPVLNPWEHCKSLTPKLLEDAAELPGAAISKNAFKVEPRASWSIGEAQRNSSNASASPLIVSKDGTKVVDVAAAAGGAISPAISFTAASAPDLSLLPPPSVVPTSSSPTRTSSAQPDPRGRRSSVARPAPTAPTPAPVPLAVVESALASTASVDGLSFASAATAVTAVMNFKSSGGKSTASTAAVAPNPPVVGPPPLRITCMTADDADTTASEAVTGSWDAVYFGTSTGAVLSLPASRLKDPTGELAAALAAAAQKSAAATTSGRTTPPRAATPASPTRGLPSASKNANNSSNKRKPGGTSASVAVELPNAGPYANVPGLRVFNGHLYSVCALCSFTHKDTKFLASSSEDKTVRVYNVATKEVVVVLADNRSVVPSLVYHRSLSRLLLAAWDGSVSVLEPRYGQRTFIVRAGSSLGAIQTITVADNYPGTQRTGPIYLGLRSGHMLAVVPVDPTSRLHTASEAVCVGAYIADRASLPEEGDNTPFAIPADVICRGGHTSSITCIAAPHEPFVFSGDSSGRVSMWCTAKDHRHRVRQFYGHVDAVSGIAVTSDGFLITASLDATVIAWSWKDGAQLSRYAPHFHKVTALLLGTLPKAKVDVASLIVSANNAMRGGGASDRWPGNSALALRYLPGVVECTMLTASFDETIAVSAIVYDQSQQ